MEISATATVALTLQTSSTVPTSGTSLSTMHASDNIGIGGCYNVDDYVITFYNCKARNNSYVYSHVLLYTKMFNRWQVYFVAQPAVSCDKLNSEASLLIDLYNMKVLIDGVIIDLFFYNICITTTILGTDRKNPHPFQFFTYSELQYILSSHFNMAHDLNEEVVIAVYEGKLCKKIRRYER